jgi:hypothetical protein
VTHDRTNSILAATSIVAHLVDANALHLGSLSISSNPAAQRITARDKDGKTITGPSIPRVSISAGLDETVRWSEVLGIPVVRVQVRPNDTHYWLTGDSRGLSWTVIGTVPLRLLRSDPVEWGTDRKEGRMKLAVLAEIVRQDQASREEEDAEEFDDDGADFAGEGI